MTWDKLLIPNNRTLHGLTLCKDCHKAHHSENGYKTKGGSE